jgi:hypothetical protein
LLVAALVRRPREVLRQRALYGITAAVVVLGVVFEVARGHSLRSLLGAYAAATHTSYSVGTVAHWLLWHLGELDLYVGVVPVLALVVLCFLDLAREEAAVVATTLSLVAWLAVEVAAFASQPSVQRIEERNLFYVAPLLFTCLVLWIERGLPRPRVAFAVGAAVAVVLAAAVPYDRFIGTAATSDTFGVLALWSVALWFHIPAEDIRWVVGAAALVLVAAAAVISRRAALVLPAIVLLLYVGAVQPVDSRTQRASIGALFQGITRPDRDWISAIVGSTDPKLVSMVWTGATDRLTVNENEFFNRDVGDVYTTNGPVPGGLAQTPIVLDWATGRFRADGKSVRVRDLLADTTLPFAGTPVGADKRKGLLLLRVDGPLRVRYATKGIYGDAWSGRTATYRRYACNGGSVVVALGSDPHLFRRAQHVEAIENGRVVASATVPPDATAKMRVPLAGSCIVHFRVARTRVPGNGDERRLGVRLVAFEGR